MANDTFDYDQAVSAAGIIDLYAHHGNVQQFQHTALQWAKKHGSVHPEIPKPEPVRTPYVPDLPALAAAAAQAVIDADAAVEDAIAYAATAATRSTAAAAAAASAGIPVDDGGMADDDGAPAPA